MAFLSESYFREVVVLILLVIAAIVIIVSTVTDNKKKKEYFASYRQMISTIKNELDKSDEDIIMYFYSLQKAFGEDQSANIFYWNEVRKAHSKMMQYLDDTVSNVVKRKYKFAWKVREKLREELALTMASCVVRDEVTYMFAFQCAEKLELKYLYEDTLKNLLKY